MSYSIIGPVINCEAINVKYEGEYSSISEYIN